MKAVVVFLSGLTTMLVGVFTRTCSDLPPEFARALCGPAALHLAPASHVHCAGCIVAAAGAALMVLAPALLLPRHQVARAGVRK